MIAKGCRIDCPGRDTRSCTYCENPKPQTQHSDNEKQHWDRQLRHWHSISLPPTRTESVVKDKSSAHEPAVPSVPIPIARTRLLLEKIKKSGKEKRYLEHPAQIFALRGAEAAEIAPPCASTFVRLAADTMSWGKSRPGKVWALSRDSDFAHAFRIRLHAGSGTG
jgi:hypothetical protein